LSLAYFGTSEFAVAVLERLVAADRRPELVLTPPDRPKGRRRRPTPPPVASAAAAMGLPVHQTANVNAAESTEALRGAGASLALVCAFGQIIREPLLSDLEMLNVHPSLLPRWRGAAPIERAIMAGDETTGAAIARITAGLDSGPLAVTRELAIEPDEDYGSLAPRLAALGAELAIEALSLRDAGALELRDQPEDGATYAQKIEPGERRLDPSRPAAELRRVVRALTPHIGAHIELAGGQRLGVTSARELAEGPGQGRLAAGVAGILLGCGDGALLIERVKPAGGREMSAVDYLRGHPLPELPG
jgi:methionyl-tRNA formyltransferase